MSKKRSYCLQILEVLTVVNLGLGAYLCGKLDSYFDRALVILVSIAIAATRLIYALMLPSDNAEYYIQKHLDDMDISEKEELLDYIKKEYPYKK